MVLCVSAWWRMPFWLEPYFSSQHATQAPPKPFAKGKAFWSGFSFIVPSI